MKTRNRSKICCCIDMPRPKSAAESFMAVFDIPDRFRFDLARRVVSRPRSSSAMLAARRIWKHSSAPERSGATSTTVHPSASNVARCASRVARTRGSSGSPPRSGHQATLTPLKSRSSGCRNMAGVDWIGELVARHRDRPSPRAETRSRRPCGRWDLLRRVRARVSSVGQLGTRPGETRKPTTLLKLPGLRSEPPVSLPSATGSMPEASAAAAPPLLPPALLVRS